jgi:hypothetical protein
MSTTNHQKKITRKRNRGGSVYPRECDCGFFLKNSQAVPIHINKECPLDYPQCDECGKKLLTEFSVTRHVQRYHINKVKDVSTTNRLDVLFKVARKELPIKKEIFYCHFDECYDTFKSEKDYDDHVEHHNTIMNRL